MSGLNAQRIVQSRIWLGPPAPTPPYPWDETFPITVYAAVRRDFDRTSSNLLDELTAIYRLINGKQDTIPGGTAGNIMTWSGIQGQIGNLQVVRTIAPNVDDRSHSSIPTERAVGRELDRRVTLTAFNAHVLDGSKHITDVERNRWNAAAPMTSLNAHITNTVVHITNEERARWNAMTSQEDFDAHIYNTDNPHNVTAHQVGTYTREQIDEMFANLRQTFFTYKNIEYNEAWNTAELVQYHPANWNPNFVLEYPSEGENLPDIADLPDPTLTYFALRPETDYRYNETNVCVIYVRRPGLTWQAVGFQEMEPGDLVIRFPDTAMFLWLSGRWVEILSRSAGGPWPGPGGLSDKLWRPIVNLDTGYLSWVLSEEVTEAPTPVRIVGQDGLSAYELAVQEGFDGTLEEWLENLRGQDGEGVAAGGETGQILIKLSNANFDTGWTTLMQIMIDLTLAGLAAPENFVWWEYIGGDIKSSSIWYDAQGTSIDGFMTQRATTAMGEALMVKINEILELVGPPSGIESIRQTLYDHMNDFNNPHKVTPELIGAVPYAAFSVHVQNFNNPHQVTAAQLGLGNVDNTRDIDKPISTATQTALDDIKDKIAAVNLIIANMNYIATVAWTNATGTLTFTFRDGSVANIVIPIADIFNGMWFDNNTLELVIPLPNGTVHRINISALIQIYVGSEGTHIHVIIENDNIVRADIIPDSITGYEITRSVHLRDHPTTTTQHVSDRSTRIATTEFVKGQVINNLISFEIDRPLSANMGRVLNNRKADIDEVIRLINELEGLTVINHLDSANPAAALSANMGRYLNLIKAPRVHTSPTGSTFGRATISLFGHARASEVDPEMDGTVFRGTDDGRYARANHRHPSDTSRAPIDSPTFVGVPRLGSRPPRDANDDRIVDSFWVQDQNAANLAICSTLGNQSVKVANLYRWRKLAGRMVVVRFLHDDTSIGNLQLNINNTGAHDILIDGNVVLPGTITAGFHGLFIFDGDAYQLLNWGTGGEVGSPPDHREEFTPPATIGVDSISEFVGFTTMQGSTLGTGSNSADSNGRVNRAIFLIPFKNPKQEPPTVTATAGTGMFQLLAGCDTRINLSNPDTIATTKTHAVISFTIASPGYPSNTPIFLVFGSSAARINVEPVGTNTLPVLHVNNTETYSGNGTNDTSEFTGFTIARGTTPDPANGEVDRVMFTIPFKNAKEAAVPSVLNPGGTNPGITINGTFRARMGDTNDNNSNIRNLASPVLVTATRTHCVLMFTITGANSAYPLNSPCHLVYASNASSIIVRPTNATTNDHIVDSERFYIESGGDILSGFTGIVVGPSTSSTNTHGESQYVNIVVPFKNLKSANPRISVSGNWWARMPDNQDIPLTILPEAQRIVTQSRRHAVIRFRMSGTYRYPKNSPCTLMYKDITARIDIDV